MGGNVALSDNAQKLIHEIAQAGMAISGPRPGAYTESDEFPEGGRLWAVAAPVLRDRPHTISVVCEDTTALAEAKRYFTEQGWAVEDGRIENTILVTSPDA